MKRKTVVVLVSAVLVVAIALAGPAESQQAKTKPDSKLSGTIRISGAWALYPMVVKWAEEFEKVYPGVRIDVSACGAAQTWAQYLGGKNQEDLKGVGVYGDPGLAEAAARNLSGPGRHQVGDHRPRPRNLSMVSEKGSSRLRFQAPVVVVGGGKSGARTSSRLANIRYLRENLRPGDSEGLVKAFHPPSAPGAQNPPLGPKFGLFLTERLATSRAFRVV